MLLTIEGLLDADAVAEFRRRLDAAEWVDGRQTAGTLSTRVKHNEQLAADSELALTLGNHVLRLLGRHPRFLSAALPERIHPPRFNRYRGGGHYGTHVDAAVMRVEAANLTLRSDLSATLFLSSPDEYEGGELLVETGFGAQSVKLAAGDLVLYPSSSLHQVTPVTRGARVAAFFWIQSLVRDPGDRALLFDLDQAIQRLSTDPVLADRSEVLALTGIYHNLVRRWADT